MARRPVGRLLPLWRPTKEVSLDHDQGEWVGALRPSPAFAPHAFNGEGEHCFLNTSDFPRGLVMTVKRLLRCTILPVALCGFLLLPGTGRASFVLITDTSGLTTEKLFNSAAYKDVNSFVGSVGTQSGGFPVTVTAGQAMDVTVDTGAGFATIKPSSSSPSPLTSLTFTPVSHRSTAVASDQPHNANLLAE